MKRISKIAICLAVMRWTSALAVNEVMPISASKATVLVFEDIIDEVELGNNEYVTRIKGKFLLIRAKNLNSKPTFLFVRYSQGDRFCNLEIEPSNSAPLKYEISGSPYTDNNDEKSDKATSNSKGKNIKYLFNQGQNYYTYSKKQYGIRITLVDIIHYKGTTYLKFNVHNKSSIDMDMDHTSFNYYDKNRFLLIFSRKENIRNVDATYLPDPLIANAFSDKDYIWGIPTIRISGGLDICFGEAEEGRSIVLSIPSNVLLKARKVK